MTPGSVVPEGAPRSESTRNVTPPGYPRAGRSRLVPKRVACEPASVLAGYRSIYRFDTSNRPFDSSKRRSCRLLELAILGLLKEQELHGYELKKRLAEALGQASGVSFGSLYPALN